MEADLRKCLFKKCNYVSPFFIEQENEPIIAIQAIYFKDLKYGQTLWL